LGVKLGVDSGAPRHGVVAEAAGPVGTRHTHTEARCSSAAACSQNSIRGQDRSTLSQAQLQSLARQQQKVTNFPIPIIPISHFYFSVEFLNPGILMSLAIRQFY